MVKLPFKRRKNTYDSTLPPEVQAYTKAEHREKMGMAWLVGVISLVVTALVLTGLFFGGRWVYRKIAGTDKKPDTSQTEKTEEGAAVRKADEEAKKEEAAKKAEEQRKKEEQAKAEEEQRKKDEAARQQAANQQPTSPNNSQIPRTGPDLDL